MKEILLCIVCFGIVGCQTSNKYNNTTSYAPSYTENSAWNYWLFVDDFTGKKECRVSYEYKYDESIGIHKATTLLIKAPIPKNSSNTVSISYRESDRASSFNKMFGKINHGPYTPWPKLNKNADIKLGTKVSLAYITNSESTAEDLYTSSVHRRHTNYEFGKVFFNGVLQNQSFSLRVNNIVYAVPQKEFDSLISCMNN